MTRVLWWRAIGYLEGIGKEGGLVGWLSVLGSVLMWILGKNSSQKEWYCID